MIRSTRTSLVPADIFAEQHLGTRCVHDEFVYWTNSGTTDDGGIRDARAQ
jgi:hypothetical protein